MSNRDKLEAIMDMQAAFQATVPNGVRTFKEYDGPKGQAHLMEHIRTQTLACITELTEALAETGWKTWASSNHLNIEAFRSELIDAFRFWLNLVHIADLSADGVMGYYQASLDKTRARVENGYDGVSSKCPACLRAYDDSHVKCSGEIRYAPAGNELPLWCAVYGHITRTGDVMTHSPGVGWVVADPA